MKNNYTISKPKKVIILGSGGLSIGQAGEFDYSGSQAIKALKEEGIQTVLINPNIATIQTSKNLADQVYFLPVTPAFVERVIQKEKPDGMLLSFGGQTALNCGVALYEKKILEKYDVKVLGTPVEAIMKTEDRKLFVDELDEIEVKTAKSIAVESSEEGIRAANDIGYPIIVRAAYALGGLGSGFCNNEEELNEILKKAFAYSPQVLIEESLKGWKEVEYEVMRDCKDNCMTVCNMENFDPLGIHTGESIVIAPSQTLNDSEYHKLRKIAIKTIRHLGIVGECNIQYALDPESEDYRVIEVNARLSRSSALASKATGYPLAFIAAKLSLGYPLTAVPNPVTKVTQAFFEPALDYLVVKFPRWDSEKFKHVKKQIGSAMKSVGEVMAIGRNFEEAIQKSIRMINPSLEGVTGTGYHFENVKKELQEPTDKRIYAVVQALTEGMTVDKIYDLTKIDKWFLYKLKHIVDLEKELREITSNELTGETLRYAKQLGFSDVMIERVLKQPKDSLPSSQNTGLSIRELRKKEGIVPVIKQIDTLAGEYPAQTNYLYLTYNAQIDDIQIDTKGVIVLGSGAYSIGSSVEFDWCCVEAIKTLRKKEIPSIVVNYNPETVSTDYDESDRLYFDELSFERVLDIYEKENPQGIIVSVGGQIPNNLALKLSHADVNILGTDPETIDRVEDRHKFSQVLDELGVDQPEWQESTTITQMNAFAKRVGYPILVRPSYVLSGAAMNVAHNEEDLHKYLKLATNVSKDRPVVLTKFITDAKEIDMDVVTYQGEVKAYAISEHVENAGVHSGDATLVTPAQKLYLETMKRVRKIVRQIIKELNITGPVNFQFLAKENEIKIIECNLRASRSFPFVSKVYDINFIELATRAILGETIERVDSNAFDLDHVGVKAPQFSFTRLHGADPQLGVEMASTGEVACMGEDIYEAFLKSLLSTGFVLPKKSILLSTGGVQSKARLLNSVKALAKEGYILYATEGTCKFYEDYGIKCEQVFWPSEKKQPNVMDLLKGGKIDLVVNIPKNDSQEELSNGYKVRRGAVDFSVPLITNLQCVQLFVDAIMKYDEDDLPVKAWEEYF